MNFLKSTLLAAVLCVASMGLTVQGAVTVYPETGSMLAGWVTTAGTNTWATNAFYLAPGAAGAAFTTNLASDVTREIDISGAKGVQFWVRGVQSNAGGATNNGTATFTFQTSPDRVLWGSPFTVTAASMGVTATTTCPIVTEDAFGKPGYIRLYSVSHTNIGPTYWSNIVYRTIKEKTQ